MILITFLAVVLLGTTTPYPTFTPPPVGTPEPPGIGFPTVTPSNFDCPPGGALPEGWGTVTPNPAWEVVCSHCLPTITPFSTFSFPTPRRTITPVGSYTPVGSVSPSPTTGATPTSVGTIIQCGFEGVHYPYGTSCFDGGRYVGYDFPSWDLGYGNWGWNNFSSPLVGQFYTPTHAWLQWDYCISESDGLSNTAGTGVRFYDSTGIVYESDIVWGTSGSESLACFSDSMDFDVADSESFLVSLFQSIDYPSSAIISGSFIVSLDGYIDDATPTPTPSGCVGVCCRVNGGDEDDDDLNPPWFPEDKECFTLRGAFADWMFGILNSVRVEGAESWWDVFALGLYDILWNVFTFVLSLIPNVGVCVWSMTFGVVNVWGVLFNFTYLADVLLAVYVLNLLISR